MATSHKYNRSEGCSICATKNSTSQFRPWYDHYSEETYCRVFKLNVLDGRRGFVCNPCVLYIKRAIQSLDFPTREQQINPPDHTRRLDWKLKGDIRPVINDIWPDGMGSSAPAAPSKQRGFFARNMTVQPKYVFTGRASFRFKSKHQLVPAGRWRDPREYMEDEDCAEEDLKYMRLYTLKKGVKTNGEKKEELRRKEAQEDARLFGEIGDFSRKCKGLKQEGQRSNYHTRAKRREVKVACKKGKNFRVHGTRGNISRVKQIDEVEDDSEDDEEIWSEDEDNQEGGKSPSVSTEDVDESASVSSSTDLKRITDDAPCKKWKNLCAEDCSLANPMKRLRCYEDDSEEMKDKGNDQQSFRSVDSTHVPRVKRRRVNRRFPRMPVRNRKLRKVSFMDMTYHLKTPFCCFDTFVGECGLTYIRPHPDGNPRCPAMASLYAKFDRQERMQKAKAAAAAAKRAAAARRAADLTKAQVAKETEVSKESEVPSPLSSGDDELNDSRYNFNSSPLVDASLMRDVFNFFGEQAEVGKASNVPASF